MKIEVKYLSRVSLDYAVARLDSLNPSIINGVCVVNVYPAGSDLYSPTTDAALAFRFIEKYKINCVYSQEFNLWQSTIAGRSETFEDPSLLISSMRCFVAFKVGKYFEMPDRLSFEFYS